jgi:16S rRNA (guanine1207-N2)-methyltransferase
MRPVTDSSSLHRFRAGVRDQELIVVGKPGVWSWESVNPGTRALVELVHLEPDAAVLDLGCGTGVIGTIAGGLASRGQVTMVDCNVVAVTCARQTLAVNDVTHAEVHLADGVEGLEPASLDVVLCHLPRGREVQRQLIRGAARVLRPEGRFFFVAHTKAGVKGAVAYGRDLFGGCGVVRQKKGYHVATTVRPKGMVQPTLRDSYETRVIGLDGGEAALVGKPGVFAWDRLDGGTACLIEAMEIERGDRVLDLGCGTGLAGLVAARRAPHGEVVLVDADLRAVRSARRTLAANGVGNGEVLLSDGVSGVVEKGPFDVVITNPPFHQGREVDYRVAYQFVRDSRTALRPGGRLFLVSNRFIGYEKLIGETFGQVAKVYADPSYHVLTAVAGGRSAE